MVGKKYWYVMYYITYQYFIMYLPITPNFFGPKWPTPSNAPRNNVAPLKTITYRAIKTTGTLIVNLTFLKVDRIKKEGGPGRWQTFAMGLGPWRSWFVCLLILFSLLISMYPANCSPPPF